MNHKSLEQPFLDQIIKSQGIIHRICQMYASDTHERQDLFQEILIQLWKSYPSFQGRSKFSTWLYRVSLNVAIQNLRVYKRRPDRTGTLAQVPEFPEMPEEDQFEEKLQWFHQALEQLSPIDKAIVMLYLEEKDNEEIAAIVGISQNYVRVKMNRIKTKLSKISKTSYHGA
ncbi:MAG: sigma-70 family RNA polymerase sigma factor [Cytophagales bacterium]|nr:sigma-70 family RNA polymerase sigma factor [Cytophagales bacterium]